MYILYFAYGGLSYSIALYIYDVILCCILLFILFYKYVMCMHVDIYVCMYMHVFICMFIIRTYIHANLYINMYNLHTYNIYIYIIEYNAI